MARQPQRISEQDRLLKEKLYKFSCETTLQANADAFIFGKVVKTGEFESIKSSWGSPGKARYFYINDISNNFVVVFAESTVEAYKRLFEAYQNHLYVSFSCKVSNKLIGQTEADRNDGKPPFGGIYRQKVKYVRGIQFHKKEYSYHPERISI